MYFQILGLILIVEGDIMARPVKKKIVSYEPDSISFGPLDYDNSLITEEVHMLLEELETIRLIDYLGLNQEECAKKMNVARTTVQAVYQSARRKLASALINGNRLIINGGSYELKNRYKKEEKEGNLMRIAVTFENGNIFQHFGHTESFKLYDCEDGRVVKSEVVPTNGQGHGALAGFLVENKVDALICGGIGGGAKNALSFRGIKLYAGVSGDCDKAVEALLNNTLEYSTDANCSHHEHEHGEGNSCGEHSCGNHSHEGGCGCH